MIENAERTVLREAQLQSNLERGIVEAEQRFLAALGEEKLRAMEMPEPKLLDALGLSEPEARGAMVLLNLDKFDGALGTQMHQEINDSRARPTWRQSEKDVAVLFPSYNAQQSFIGGKEVPYATPGSSRPDFYETGSSIEVKNYNVTSESGRKSLINTVVDQVNKRIMHLPDGTKQTIIIDVRGQQVTNEVLRQIKASIIDKCSTEVIIRFMR